MFQHGKGQLVYFLQRRNYELLMQFRCFYLDDQHVDHTGVRDVLVFVEHLPHFLSSLARPDVQLVHHHCRRRTMQTEAPCQPRQLHPGTWITVIGYISDSERDVDDVYDV